ncbi:hypothetical protein D7X98_05835 [bacterium 1XD8-76]|nr:hypothetical protein D7X98_05835 [bacterium 1XD8-76]
MTGFVVDDIETEEWVDDTWSLADSLDDSAYEKSMEYSADNRPAYHVVKGDDGTLYDRHYRHNLCWRGCADHHNDTVLLRGKA